MKRLREQGFGRQFWCNHVAKHATSGKTQAAYAAENGLKYQSLSAWVNKLAREARDLPGGSKRRLGRRASSSGEVFAKIAIADTSTAVQTNSSRSAAPMRLVFPGGVALDLGPGFDVGVVAQLIAATGSHR